MERPVLNKENLCKSYYEDGLTQQECADLFGYSKRTIQEYFSKWSLKGRKYRNDNWKKRISEKLKGNKNSAGVVFSEERKNKMSSSIKKTLQKKIKEEGYHWGHTGKKHTEETIDNLRNIQIKKLQEKFYLGKMTRLEKKGYEKLNEHNIEYEPQKQIGYYLIDAYIPKENVVVEFQGKYWHSREDIKRKDEAKRSYLNNLGYKVVEVWEDDINSWDPRSL